MKHSLLGLAILAFAGIAGLQGTAQEAPPRAVILRVQPEAGSDLARPMARSGADVQMPKFFDQDVRRGATWAVYWQATGTGLPAGTTILFEYYLKTAPGLRSVHLQYDYVTRGERKATFVIPEKDYREGGTVQAWRVRMVHSGQLLAERTATNWPAASKR